MLNKHYKYFILFSLIVLTAILSKLYVENQNSKQIQELSVKYQTKAISDFMIAFRSTYQNIFIQNHIKLDEENIKFLPVKTTNEIAHIFSTLNANAKISTVSDRPRNKINMANPRQLEIIRHFQETKTDTSVFKHIGDKYYYSTPMYINPVCLKCHGKREDAPKLIREKYADAYNYKLGELRGIIDIEVSQTELSVFVQENNNYRTIYVIILLFIILLTAFVYAVSNRKLEKHIQDEIEKSKEVANELNKSIVLFGENVIASNSDLKGIITYASPALCDISAYSQKELIGKQHNILRHPDMPSSLFKGVWETIQSGKVWNGEVKNKTKQGGYYWTRTTIMPTFDKKNNITGYSSIRHNITSQKAKEEFLANMSHELRTPLNAIIGFSGILNKKLTDTANIEFTKQISSSSNSLLTLINDILDLAKIKDSKFTIEAYNFNAYDEILEHSKRFEGLTAEKNINFHINIDKNLKAIYFGDWIRISQIILNIVSNSIKFTPEHGEIIYDVSYKNQESLVLSVQDNGIGMSKEVQDKIFKPFEQADGSTTRQYGGTGLGLSITQSLVELMKGKIELKSQEWKGSTFRITLPLKRVKDEEVDEIPEIILQENKEDTLHAHILVAEDNKTNQMLIKIFLTDFGLSCDIANDGIEAVEMYDPSIHALILMDENMPNMNGIEAMKILKLKFQEDCGAIIALTANAMEGDKQRFLDAGMDGYVAKPIDEDVLYNTLKNNLH